MSDQKSKKAIPVIGPQATDEDWLIEKGTKKFVITGKKIERFARRTDFNSEAGQERLRDIMAKMGIIRELKRQGVEAGWPIIIGQPEIGHLSY